MKSKTAAEETFIVLYNVRSIHNVASVFRTADGLGISQILLVGYSPAPVDRFGRPRKDFAKVALGAEKSVSWRHFPGAPEAFRFLKGRGVFTIALEQTEQAADYRKVKFRRPMALVFGNEVDGLPRKVFMKCGAVAQIPMRGRKESLNVSVAVGIAAAVMLKR